MNLLHILLILFTAVMITNWIVIFASYVKHFDNISMFYFQTILRNSFLLRQRLLSSKFGVWGLVLYIVAMLISFLFCVIGAIYSDFPLCIGFLFVMVFDPDYFIFTILYNFVINAVEYKKFHISFRNVDRFHVIFEISSNRYKLYVEDDSNSNICVHMNTVERVDKLKNEISISESEKKHVHDNLISFYLRHGYMCSNSPIDKNCLEFKLFGN